MAGTGEDSGGSSMTSKAASQLPRLSHNWHCATLPVDSLSTWAQSAAEAQLCQTAPTYHHSKFPGAQEHGKMSKPKKNRNWNLCSQHPGEFVWFSCCSQWLVFLWAACLLLWLPPNNHASTRTRVKKKAAATPHRKVTVGPHESTPPAGTSCARARVCGSAAPPCAPPCERAANKNVALTCLKLAALTC